MPAVRYPCFVLSTVLFAEERSVQCWVYNTAVISSVIHYRDTSSCRLTSFAWVPSSPVPASIVKLLRQTTRWRMCNQASQGKLLVSMKHDCLGKHFKWEKKVRAGPCHWKTLRGMNWFGNQRCEGKWRLQGWRQGGEKVQRWNFQQSLQELLKFLHISANVIS